MDNLNIPKEVIAAAKSRLYASWFIEQIGVYKGKAVFTVSYTEPMTIGLPEYYLWDGKAVTTITGLDALKLAETLF